MNVLFISHSASTYGAEISLWDLLEQSRNAGWRPIVVSPANGALVSRLRKLEIKAYVFPHFSWYSHNRGRVKCGIKTIMHGIGVIFLRSLHVRFPFRLVYSNTLASYIGALFAQRYQIPHIWHLHEFLGENIAASFDQGYERCMKWIGSASDRVIYNSETTKAAYAGWVPDSRGVVIPNGTAGRYFEAFSTRSTGKANPIFELSVIGKVIPVKQIEVAIKALGLLRADSKKAFLLHVVGDGDPHYIGHLKRTAKVLGVSELIQWHGFQADPLPFYARSGAVLINSRLETFCRTACEAMASGCPVIVSDAGEPRRYIMDGETGYVYPEGDSALLAEQVKKSMTDCELRDRIIQNAFGYAKAHWNVLVYAQKIMSVMADVMGTR